MCRNTRVKEEIETERPDQIPILHIVVPCGQIPCSTQIDLRFITSPACVPEPRSIVLISGYYSTIEGSMV
jgi:hypothetical protein